MAKAKLIKISDIQREGLQLRACTNREHVERLRELFDPKARDWPEGLPPVIVFLDGKGVYHLADGFHRLEAAVEEGRTQARVEIRSGTRRDALTFALGANAEHGLPRTNEDKHNALRMAYQMNPSFADRALARLCRVSHTFASTHLKAIRGGDKSEAKPPAKPEAAAPAGNIASDRQEEGGRATEAAAPAKTATPAAPASPARSGDAGAPHGRDMLGLAIPSESSSEAFACHPYFDDLLRLFASAQGLINQIAHLPGGELYRAEHLKMKSRSGANGESVSVFYSADLENAAAEARHWRPFAGLCPHCKGTPKDTCRACKGLPYLTQKAWERTPEKLREAIAKERQQGGE